MKTKRQVKHFIILWFRMKERERRKKEGNNNKKAENSGCQMKNKNKLITFWMIVKINVKSYKFFPCPLTAMT